MRINKEVLLEISNGQSSKEGVMFYKSNESNFKERWFKLCSNMLFVYNDYLASREQSAVPSRAFIMENFIIHTSQDMPNKFTFYFLGEPDIKYSFFCSNSRQTNEWFELFNHLSYRKQRIHLNNLRSQLKEITGTDPLESTPWFNKL